MKKQLISMFFFLCFASFLLAQTPIDSEKAAKDAVQRLEAALGGINDSARVTQGRSQPRWVNNPYSAYSKDRFFAVVGSASNRNHAETRAFANLIAIFGQSIRSEFTVTSMYTEALNNGTVSVSDNTRIRDRISMAAAMDNLIGAEIGNVWVDSRRGTVYAIAFMDKTKTISIYTDLITINNRNIELLTAMSPGEKNTFDAYARYRLAAQIAGINTNYATVVSQAGGSVASINLRNANTFNLEAENIWRNITVTVRVTNDRANRVQDAFARVLSSEGLRTMGSNPAYTLDIRLDVNEVSFPGNNFIFSRMECSANLIENLSGASLLPFNFNLREGHATYANAEVAVFRSAEGIIAESYPAVLREYLESLVPK